MPRRLHAFAPDPGRRVLWRNVPVGAGPAIEAGTALADANGLVTVTNVLITPEGNRLVLDADELTDSDGDGAPDYWEIRAASIFTILPTARRRQWRRSVQRR